MILPYIHLSGVPISIYYYKVASLELCSLHHQNNTNVFGKQWIRGKRAYENVAHFAWIFNILIIGYCHERLQLIWMIPRVLSVSIIALPFSSIMFPPLWSINNFVRLQLLIGLNYVRVSFTPSTIRVIISASPKLQMIIWSLLAKLDVSDSLTKISQKFAFTKVPFEPIWSE